MSAIVRKTYDTDSIVIRRLYAVDPDTNAQVSTNYILATTSNGRATFQDGSAYLSTIGIPTSALLQSTVAGLGTYGYISTAGGGSGDVTKNQLISTVAGLGTYGYLSTPGGAGDVTRANLTSTTLGLGTLGYVSTQTLTSSLLSTVKGLGSIYLSSGGAAPVYDSEIASTLRYSGFFSNVKLGYFAGSNAQGNLAVAIGNYAGSNSQATLGIAIGDSAAGGTQGTAAIAIGASAGKENQGSSGIAIGYATGYTNQGANSVAIGNSAAYTGQKTNSVAIGPNAGTTDQGSNAVAIGNNAGNNTQGDYSIAIGYGAGQANQPISTIIMNALGSNVNPSQDRALYIAPVRYFEGSQNYTVGYNTTTLEVGLIDSLSRLDVASTVRGLATSGYISTSQLTSTVANISQTFSTVYNISSAGGINISGTTTGFYINNTNANISTLINNNITINTTGGNVNDVDLTSTNRGLGTFGYLSSAVDLISTPVLNSTLISTVRGLGTIGYLSTAVTKIIAGTNISITPTLGTGIVTIDATGGGGGGGSGDVTSTNLTSTTLGLGTLGYISSSTLQSTVVGLGLLGYVSSTALPSTVLGLSRFYVSSSALPSTVLGLSRFYVSTAGLGSNLSSFSTSISSNFFTRTLTASTATIDLLNISTISFGAGSGFITFPFIRASYVSTLSTQMDYGLVNTYLSGPRLIFSSLQGDGSQITNLSTGITSTVQGLGTLGYVSTPTLNGTLLSTVQGLGTLGYVSTPTLNSTLLSTVQGLGTINYLSGPITTVNTLTATDVNTQNLFVAYADIPAISTNLISAGTATVPVISVSSYINLNNTALTTSTYISSLELKNLRINEVNVNSFGPVRVKVSTLGAAHAYLNAYDISKYFLFTQNNTGYSVSLPTYNISFEGWNCVIRNMPGSAYSFALSTTTSPSAGANIAPGVSVTVLGSENSFYII